MIVGLSGTRCVGKDTVFELLSSILVCTRYAFADALKQDLKVLIKDQFNINVLNPNPQDKEFIRPILISYGCAWREKDPEHWVKKVINQVSINPKSISVIVDLRFQNEVDLLKKTFGDSFIHVNITNSTAPPPTQEEEKHYKKVAEQANYHINWGNNTLEERQKIVQKLSDYLLQHL